MGRKNRFSKKKHNIDRPSIVPICAVLLDLAVPGSNIHLQVISLAIHLEKLHKKVFFIKKGGSPLRKKSSFLLFFTTKPRGESLRP